MTNIKVMDKICVWVVFNSSLNGFGYFSGMLKSPSIVDPLNCSDVPSTERPVV